VLIRVITLLTASSSLIAWRTGSSNFPQPLYRVWKFCNKLVSKAVFDQCFVGKVLQDSRLQLFVIIAQLSSKYGLIT
jgi:hypothetical protein